MHGLGIVSDIRNESAAVVLSSSEEQCHLTNRSLMVRLAGSLGKGRVGRGGALRFLKSISPLSDCGTLMFVTLKGRGGGEMGGDNQLQHGMELVPYL